MKAVMISIRPAWCKLIVDGRKTIEVRKSIPKLEVPFKCFIYCTDGSALYRSCYDHEIRFYRAKADANFAHHTVLNRKIIGEFVCDKLVWVISHPPVFANKAMLHLQALHDAALTIDEAEDYANGKDLFGWHISDLVIYDQPKPLEEFSKYGFGRNGPLRRPPLSWWYIEAQEP